MDMITRNIVVLTTLIIVLPLVGCSKDQLQVNQNVQSNEAVARVINRCDLPTNSITTAEIKAYLSIPQGAEDPLIVPMNNDLENQSASLQIEIDPGTIVKLEIRANVSSEANTTQQTTLASASRTVEGNTLNFESSDFVLNDNDGNGLADCTELLPSADGSLWLGSIPLGFQDYDNDGLINDEDSDADGDGIDGEDIIDPDIADISSTQDRFLDLDDDGIDERTDLPQCRDQSGADGLSANSNWNDNCLVTRNNVFTDSLYTVGIQSIVYCAGFGGDASYGVFVDGEFGPITESAVKEFQQSLPDALSDDGQVGPSTWAKLNSKVELLISGELTTDDNGQITGINTYGFKTGPCANIPLFYQEVSQDPGSNTTVGGGWRLARDQPNEAESIPFSIDFFPSGH